MGTITSRRENTAHKIYGSEVEIAEHAHPSNQIITDGKSLKIAHPEGFLIITEI